MDITKIKITYGKDYNNPMCLSVISSLMPLITLRSGGKIKTMKDLAIDVVNAAPSWRDDIIIMNISTLRLLATTFKSKLETVLATNKLLIIEDIDRHIRWRELVDDHPWLGSNPSIYKITDSPDLEDPQTLFLHGVFLNSHLNIDGLHLLDGKNHVDSFFCLMNKQRPHRDLLIRALANADLLTKHHVIYHENPYADIGLRSAAQFSDLAGFNDAPSQWADGHINRFYNTHALELVPEYSHKLIYFSEKTAKPLLAGMPFMTIAAKGQLAYLKEMGFKTFDQYWDESYDQEEDLVKRINMIVDNIEALQSNPGKLLAIYRDSRQIAEHNRDHLLAFKGQQSYHMAKQLRQFIEGI
jgi:hypothetical protein